jgi:ParB family chromosome partitioning protein
MGPGLSRAGQGIAALFPTAAGETIRQIALDQIRPNRHQPRQQFSKEGLDSLAESIRQHGLLQPILVQADGEGLFELIAGERRWRAARLAGLSHVPAIVKVASDRDRMEWALLENVQREDLNPLEKAEGYAKLIAEFSLTQEEIAGRMGIDRSSVANFLRLLHLPKTVWPDLAAGRLSMGHAKVILSLEEEADRIALAQQIITLGWSVRQAESFVKQEKRPDAPSPRPATQDPATTEVETRLRHALGTRVRLLHRGKQGEIRIVYHSLDELDRLLEQLTAPPVAHGKQVGLKHA